MKKTKEEVFAEVEEKTSRTMAALAPDMERIDGIFKKAGLDYQRILTGTDYWIKCELLNGQEPSHLDIIKRLVRNAAEYSLDFHNLVPDTPPRLYPIQEDGETEPKKEYYRLLDDISSRIVSGEISSLDSAQTYLNNELLNSDVYRQVHEEAVRAKDVQDADKAIKRSIGRERE